jgi:hypothetical protein
VLFTYGCSVFVSGASGASGGGKRGIRASMCCGDGGCRGLGLELDRNLSLPEYILVERFLGCGGVEAVREGRMC